MIIPHNFSPRDYQLPLLRAMDNGTKRAFIIFHRRAGKDILCWNFLIKKAFEEVGVYYYFLPTGTQAKKIIFDGIRNDGFSFMEHIPQDFIENQNSIELKTKLKNGSIIQLIGTDRYDSIRGTNPKGCVFSEYAFQNPMAWQVIRPILAMNGGWAIFNTTPNGKNHAYELFEFAKQNENWFTQLLTVDDTGIISQKDLEEEKLDMMSEMFEQEYYCSFEIGTVGSYYGEQLQKAKQENRICKIEIQRGVPVDIYFDLGRNDATSIWFKQNCGENFNFIKYYENNGKHIDEYFEEIDFFLDEKKLQIGKIFLPHDSSQKRIDAKESVLEIAKKRYGGNKVQYIPVTKSTTDDINTTRKILDRCFFDKDLCQQGINCLENYKKKYDEKRKVFLSEPNHDWASHGADSFRYFAVSINFKKLFIPKVA
jgi:hypothetical protein